jgi:hypothetical protein
MVVNFRARGISRGARKLARTPTIIIKKKRFSFAVVRQARLGFDVLSLKGAEWAHGRINLFIVQTSIIESVVDVEP